MASTVNDISSTTQQYLDIYDIANDILIMKDGSTSLIITVSAMNFGLLAEPEQDAIMYAYAGLLNSLNYPIQIVIRSQTKDVTNYLQLLKNEEENTTSETRKNWISRYRRFVGELIKERNVLDKKFYVAIPATNLEMGLLPPSSVLPGSQQVDISKIERSVILDKAREILEPKRDYLIQQFSRIGLQSRQLSTQEIIQLFYLSYNPEAAEGQQITDTNSYTTPLVQAGMQGGNMMDNVTSPQAQQNQVTTQASDQVMGQAVAQPMNQIAEQPINQPAGQPVGITPEEVLSQNTQNTSVQNQVATLPSQGEQTGQSPQAVNTPTTTPINTQSETQTTATSITPLSMEDTSNPMPNQQSTDGQPPSPQPFVPGQPSQTGQSPQPILPEQPSQTGQLSQPDQPLSQITVEPMPTPGSTPATSQNESEDIQNEIDSTLKELGSVDPTNTNQIDQVVDLSVNQDQTDQNVGSETGIPPIPMPSLNQSPASDQNAASNPQNPQNIQPISSQPMTNDQSMGLPTTPQPVPFELNTAQQSIPQPVLPEQPSQAGQSPQPVLPEQPSQTKQPSQPDQPLAQTTTGEEPLT